ncbi:MAG: SIMPL domain-containing protein [Candidatus Taylorbacteria bacterium]|nr:SIMPL domain-containing protein [Candidatus Taylorbacteria bacterium]
MNSEFDVKVCAWKTAIAVGALLALFLLVLTIKEIKSIAYVGRDIPTQSTITVSGHGEEIAIPDIATFSFSVIEQAKTLEAARELATTKINKAVEVLDQNKIAKNDMKTTSYNVYPKYDYEPTVCTTTFCRGRKQVLLGYEINQTLEVKVRDVTKVGEVFVAIGAVGVSNVGGLEFSVDKRDVLVDSARVAAIADAKVRAEKLAQTLGVKLVRIVSYSDASGGYAPMYYAKSAMMDSASGAAVPPQVPTGEQKISSDVNVTYEIR